MMIGFKILKELCEESGVSLVARPGWSEHPVYLKVGSGIGNTAVTQIPAGWKIADGEVIVDPGVYEAATGHLSDDGGLWSKQAYADAVVGMVLQMRAGERVLDMPIQTAFILFLVHCEASSSRNVGLEWADEAGLTVEDVLETAWSAET